MALNERNQNKLVDIGLKVGLLGAGVFLANKVYKKWLSNSQGAQAGSDPNTQAASLLYAAMYQSGVSILSWADGTDEKSLYKTAEQITDFAKVSAAYKNLYGSNLADDLTNELSTDELQAFYLALKKPQLAAQNAASFASANKFKYRIGQKLKTNPTAGTAKIGYYAIVKTATSRTLKLQRWNQLTGTICGTVVGYRVQKIVDFDKVIRTVNLYLVGNIPNVSSEVKYYVFEREVLKA